MGQKSLLCLLLLSGISGVICRAAENSEGEILALFQRADRQLLDGAMRDAEKTLIDACAKAEQLNTLGPLLAVAGNRLGNLYHDAGEPNNAEIYFLKALPAARKWGPDRAIRVLNNLTALYLETGQYTKAERLGLAAAIARAPSDVDTTRAKSNLASLAVFQGRVPDAEKLFTDAVKEFDAAGDVQDEAIVLSNIGLLFLREDRLDAGADRLKRAAELVKARSDIDPAAKMKVFINLGAAHLRSGQRADAAECFREAAAHSDWWSGRAGSEVGAELRTLAEGLRLTGDKAEAKRFRKLADAATQRDGAVERGLWVVDVADLLPKNAPK